MIKTKYIAPGRAQNIMYDLQFYCLWYGIRMQLTFQVHANECHSELQNDQDKKKPHPKNNQNNNKTKQNKAKP